MSEPVFRTYDGEPIEAHEFEPGIHMGADNMDVTPTDDCDVCGLHESAPVHAGQSKPRRAAR